MSPRQAWGGDDHNITLDAADDDWEWRRKIRSNPHSRRIYRFAVGLLGLMVVVAGLLLIPLPGPGWVVLFLGLGIWSSEFEWAQRLLHWVKDALDVWTRWLKTQPWWMKVVMILLAIAAVAAIFWLLLLISGLPGYLPDPVVEWLEKVPGLAS
jgi:uncharacterized protein (TIGR02611 family)